MSFANVFSIPIGNKVLLYAPLHQFTALVNQAALFSIRDSLQRSQLPPPVLQPVVDQLLRQPVPPSKRTGPLDSPVFLGIIPTRGCNMACAYCDFAALKHDSPIMSLPTARQAVDAYFEILRGAATTQADIHFFGGEPFFADHVIHFVVSYANMRAEEYGMTVNFEATTNGLYSANRCRWIAEHFSTIVLSLDGTPDIQDRHRPGINGAPLSDIIIRNAKILSEGPVELVIRACVTAETVVRLPAIAEWISQEFRPSTVCFETLSLSHVAADIAFAPPDPWEFATYFDQAARILHESGIETVISTADLYAPRVSFCPVGKDALIVSPDGAVDTCYLLQKDWESSGLNLRLGWLRESGFELSPVAIQHARDLNVDTRPLCADCFCRFSCAGGCHVNHDTSRPPGGYDDLCIQTRLITVTRLLRQIGQDSLADTWLADRDAAETAVWQPNDRLLCPEVAS